MSNKGLRNFYLGIVLPSILTICLFIISIYAIIIPSFERNIMERKKEMIREITTVAWSLIDEYYKEYRDSVLTLEQAKSLAASKIGLMRYGADRKDYFWITDIKPVMIMHPYRKELNGTDLSDYRDPEGTRLFVEAVKIVIEKGEGFIHYIWQWKDDPDRLVPKLSYVKGFPEWGWIIGTGIYLDDVKQEIAQLKNRLLRISFIIILVIILTLIYIIRQSLRTEKRRKEAEDKLRLSRQKYQSLVEASTDGTIMLIANKVIFSNLTFNRMIGYPATEVTKLRMEDIFELDPGSITSVLQTPGKSENLETRLKCSDKRLKEVVITVSRVKYSSEDGLIIIVKDMTMQKNLEKETSELTYELQTSLLLMNQSIKDFVKVIASCRLDSSILEAAKLMKRKNQPVLFIRHGEEIIGIITDSDLRRRALAEEMDLSLPISAIMTSPVISISENALLYEVELIFNNDNISHLGVKDQQGKMTGVISREDIFELQRNSLSYIIKEIDIAEDVSMLRKLNNKLPVLVKALIESSDKAYNITRIITSISDAISKRLVSLCIEETGVPPCNFAFMAMGSEGRMEQTLATDQDNAIIIEDLEKGKMEEARPYFIRLAEKINQKLDEVGYSYCKGEVMAKNPKWTHGLKNWKLYFTEWVEFSDPQSILEASIFFDFRCVYGKQELVDALRKHVNEICMNQSVFFYHMAQPVLKFKSPVNMFGNIVGDSDAEGEQQLNIKKVLLPLLSFTRIYALKHNLGLTNTISRLRELKKLGVISPDLFEEMILSYNYLMQLRFRFQLADLKNNTIPGNMVDIGKLTNIEIATLKKIFSLITELQTKLSFDFKGGIG